MAGNGRRKEGHRRLCEFAGRVARGVSDSRRQRLSVDDRAAEIFQQKRPVRWPVGDWTCVETVRLPESPDQELLLVLSWRNAEAPPWMLLVSPQARKAGRNGTWFVKAFRRRLGVEDATWGIKQRFHLEAFLVQSWRSIRLTLQERDRIAQLRHQGADQKEIAQAVERCPSTISRELRRNRADGDIMLHKPNGRARRWNTPQHQSLLRCERR